MRAIDPEESARISNPKAAESSSNSVVGLACLIAAILALGILVSWSWAFIVLAIVFMIFMHELGHYLTAKLTGMKVVEFFIGFGPRIWSFRRKETTFGVKAIPAGAYVRIIGMNNLDFVPPGEEHLSYRVKSFPRKLLVVSAGSLMHFLMAIALLFAVLFFYGRPSNDGQWAVAAVSEQSAAAQLGMQNGDEILAVDGLEITSFQQFGEVVRARAGQEVEVAFARGDETTSGVVELGSRLTEQGAQAIDGLLPLDRIVEVDGIAVGSWAEVVAAVDGRIGQELEFVVATATSDELLTVDQGIVRSLPPANIATSGFFGVGPEFLHTRSSLNLFDSTTGAVSDFVAYTQAIVVGFADLVAGGGIQNFVTDTFGGNFSDTSAISSVAAEREALASPDGARSRDEQRLISIYGAARLGTQLTDQGLGAVLIFLAGLNISIGLLNLIPLPPLDGGHIAVAVYERLRSIGGRRYQVDYAKVIPVAYGVFALLLGVGLLAVFRDIFDPINL